MTATATVGQATITAAVMVTAIRHDECSFGVRG